MLLLYNRELFETILTAYIVQKAFRQEGRAIALGAREEEGWPSPCRCLHHLSPTPTTPHRNEYRSQSTVSNREMPTTAQANRAALNYCKCAVLFFIALLVTWVPSTINRVYSLVHPDSVVFGLDFASGLVLPLQGFWNAVVYIATGFPACQALVGKMRDAFGGGRGRRSESGGSTSTSQGKENNLKTSRNCLSRRTESTENLTDT